MRTSKNQDLSLSKLKVEDIKAIRIRLASPEEILKWSHGEVKKPETINYRTQRAERDGLFCEKIFGPEKNYQCYCGKYKGVKYKGIVCDRCGVEVTSSVVRRERMGHIKLAVPVAHIWYLRGVPSIMGIILRKSREEIEKVVYFVAYIVMEVDEEKKKKILEKIEQDFEKKLKEISKIEDEKERKEKEEALKREKEEQKREVLEISPLKIISETKLRNLTSKYGNFFKVGTGAEALRKIFEKIDLKEEIKKMEKEIEGIENPEMKREIFTRLRLFKKMEKAKIRPEWMFLTVLPVLPPELRPIVQIEGGKFASSDLNDLYRRVIHRNNRLKYMIEIGAPEIIIRNEKRLLQEAVDALLDNGMRKAVTTRASTGGRRLLKSLADLLRGKEGRFRQNLLGKRVDYSGRSVIVVDPNLKIHQVGLPKTLALEIFRPFVLRKILEKNLAPNLRAAQELIELQEEEVWECLEEVVRDKVVLLNRAPTLHRLNVQAFYPVLIEGKAIAIPPLICKGYNADFDGDQMGVFLPITKEAQEEAKNFMISKKNLLKPASGLPIVTLYQDIVLGCYYLTEMVEGAKGEGKVFSSFEEAILAWELDKVDLRAKIKVYQGNNEFLETTPGRIIFNSVLPKNFPFQNKQIKIKDLENLVLELYLNYPLDEVCETIEKIKKLGFEFATLSGTTFALDELTPPPQKEKILEEAEKKAQEIEKQYEKGFLTKREKLLKKIEIYLPAIKEVENTLSQTLSPQNSILRMVSAGARGSFKQVMQILGMKGLVTNPLGEIIELLIKRSYYEGLSVLEYFISTHGARKGQTDKALRTSSAGYLTRRLVDVVHEVIVREKDCKDQKGVEILRKDAEEIGQRFFFKILGRIVLEDVKTKTGKVIVKKGEMIDYYKALEIEKEGIEKIRVRSPLTCKTKYGVCQKCYGLNLADLKEVELGTAVGILAAQSIGEPGTQLTMRTFHYGGVFGEADITTGIPRVEEIFENREPKIEAKVSEVEGKVVEVEERKIKIKDEKTGKIFEYEVLPGLAILVEKGQKVKRGQKLTEGNLNFKKLFEILDREEFLREIVKEIQKVYVSQGVQIHDKHIEIVIRQMLSRVKIISRGDSDFLEGEIVEKDLYLEEKERLKREGKTPPKAKEILLGISKVALTTSSFLSAASFQETTRVLILASIEGKEDKLRGLKENVILGKLIPVGTGFVKDEEKTEEC
jgi:DNA-directed RNA polymerase subunit beta'